MRTRIKLYDGRIYGLILEPFLAGLHAYVAEQLEPGRRILDVGCGTGGVLRKLAVDAEWVEGADLSPAMIAQARRRAEAEGLHNVSFRVGDASESLRELPDDSFDHATMVLALHEMPAAVRVALLGEVSRVSGSILCVDFRVPMPRNFHGLRNRTLEFLAGWEHFSGFRDFNRRGGIEGIAREARLDYQHLRHVDGESMELAWLKRREGAE